MGLNFTLRDPYGETFDLGVIGSSDPAYTVCTKTNVAEGSYVRKLEISFDIK